MTISSDAGSRIASIIQSLEETRASLSEALKGSECGTGFDRMRMEDLHRRLTRALSALHGDARDW
ncbi:MAG: hypothetical protein ACK5JR_08515 [Tropicimonas sp.]|uniref:hypothetical protein n=1 Tax=Tropicimonas sp. TaxID=2067044 RepID=UPI003A83563B